MREPSDSCKLGNRWNVNLYTVYYLLLLSASGILVQVWCLIFYVETWCVQTSTATNYRSMFSNWLLLIAIAVILVILQHVSVLTIKHALWFEWYGMQKHVWICMFQLGVSVFRSVVGIWSSSGLSESRTESSRSFSQQPVWHTWPVENWQGLKLQANVFCFTLQISLSQLCVIQCVMCMH